MNVVIITVKGIDHNGEIIADKVEIVTDDHATNDANTSKSVDDIVEYYKRRFPLTTKAMGL